MYGYQGFQLKSFALRDSYNYFERMKSDIKNEIENKGKKYLLSIDEQEFEKFLIEKFSIEPLCVDFDKEEYNEPSITIDDSSTNRASWREVYFFTIKYPFTGSPELFSLRPTNHILETHDIYVNFRLNVVSFSFNIDRQLSQQNPQAFIESKNRKREMAFCNLENANKDVQSWNTQLPGLVHSQFTSIKQKYLKENSFFEAINVKVNKDTSSVFVPPTIKKTIVPQPEVSKKKSFSSEPMMAQEMYEDVLQVIYDSGKSMEKKPALYQGKDEEGLRDQFLFVLETRYVGITATGETFNRAGKTDILLKYAADGSNLFVAECKFWHGSEEFLQALSQLFDRYLTWRDSKAALIMFVKNKDFSNVLQNIQEKIKIHQYFSKEQGVRGDSSFSYLFYLPQDKSKPVHLEVMAFHYDK